QTAARDFENFGNNRARAAAHIDDAWAFTGRKPFDAEFGQQPGQPRGRPFLPQKLAMAAARKLRHEPAEKVLFGPYGEIIGIKVALDFPRHRNELVDATRACEPAEVVELDHVIELIARMEVRAVENGFEFGIVAGDGSVGQHISAEQTR